MWTFQEGANEVQFARSRRGNVPYEFLPAKDIICFKVLVTRPSKVAD